MSHFGILLSVTFFCYIRNIIVQSTRRKGMANREQSIHPVGSLADLPNDKGIYVRHGEVIAYLIILVTPGMVLPHSHDEV